MVLIMDNIWQSPPGVPAEYYLPPYQSLDQLPSGPKPYRAAVRIKDIPEATFSGNSVRDSDAFLSVIFAYSVFSRGNKTLINSLDLQLANNTARVDMKEPQRQINLYGLRFDFTSPTIDADTPLEGMVNITGNTCLDLVRAGSFAHGSQYNLSIIQADNDCPGADITPSSTAEPSGLVSDLPVIRYIEVTVPPVPFISASRGAINGNVLIHGIYVAAGFVAYRLFREGL